MSDETTARLELPLLVPGQAQKEMIHNEALALIDIALAGGVEAVGQTAPPADPALGACWIVGAAPTGAWAGRADSIAGWTAGGWRFVAPRAGMTAWNAESASVAAYRDGAWRTGQPLGEPLSSIPVPTGGGVIDAEGRAAISNILLALQHFALIDR